MQTEGIKYYFILYIGWQTFKNWITVNDGKDVGKQYVSCTACKGIRPRQQFWRKKKLAELSKIQHVHTQS